MKCILDCNGIDLTNKMLTIKIIYEVVNYDYNVC